MTKEAEARLLPQVARFYELKAAKDAAERELKTLGPKVKATLKELGIECDMVGDYLVELSTVGETLIVDTDKIKADGLFEKYSKKKAGYTTLSVTKKKEG